MPKKLTQQIFNEKLKTKHGNKYKILDKYYNYETKNNFLCNVCDNTFSTTPHSILGGSGCPECGKKIAINTIKWKISFEDYIKRLPSAITENIIFLDKTYTGRTTSVNVQCLKCNFVWKTNFKNLQSGYGCKMCGHEKNKQKTSKTHESFNNEVQKIYNSQIELLSKYISGSNPIRFKCKLCGTTSKKIKARNLLYRGCKECCLTKGENKIKKILQENNISFITQFSFDDYKKYKFDFALIKNDKVYQLIEYDGQHHFRPIKYFGGIKRFEIQKKNDLIKNKISLDKKIKLIRIPYFLFNTITLKDLKINETT